MKTKSTKKNTQKNKSVQKKTKNKTKDINEIKHKIGVLLETDEKFSKIFQNFVIHQTDAAINNKNIFTYGMSWAYFVAGIFEMIFQTVKIIFGKLIKIIEITLLLLVTTVKVMLNDIPMYVANSVIAKIEFKRLQKKYPKEFGDLKIKIFVDANKSKINK